MKNIYFAAPITHHTSYGIVALNITEQLAKRDDINLSIGPIGGTPTYDPFLPEQNLTHLHNKELDGEIISIVLFHQGMLSQHHHPKATKRIGFPIFELDGFSQKELEDLQFQDEFFVCSQWAKNVIQKYFPDKPVHVVPLGYNPKLYQFLDEPVNKYENRTVFLNVGKWEYRKCHDKLAHIFRRAFSKIDNVLLLMCPTNFFIGQQENERLKNEYKSILGDQVHFYDRLESQKDMADVQKLSFGSIQISHSEGWGLPAFESMVLGKPTILTNYGGYTEFANDYNSYLVHIHDLEPANDGLWFHGQHNWAAIREDQIFQTIEYLKFIHKYFQNNGPHNFIQVHNSVKHLTWENSTQRIINAL